MYNICITISGAAQSNELAPTADETRMSGSRSEWFAGFHGMILGATWATDGRAAQRATC